jgi:cytochrome c biogenesis protein ResB
MKKITLLFLLVVSLSGCNHSTRLYDSEIDAIRDQTEVLQKLVDAQNKHNELLERQLNCK